MNQKEECFNCNQRQTMLVKLTEREEFDKPTVVAPNLNRTQICENPNCWAYLDFSKIDTWEKK